MRGTGVSGGKGLDHYILVLPYSITDQIDEDCLARCPLARVGERCVKTNRVVAIAVYRNQHLQSRLNLQEKAA